MTGGSEKKDWAAEHFRGAENIVLPSFTADLRELDEQAIRLDVRQSIRHGVFSAFCSIEAGLTLPEQKRFLEVVKDEAGDEVLVGLPTAADSLGANVELLEHAAALEASHALISYPANFRPETQDDVYRYTREMCEATDLAIVLFINDKFGFERLHPGGVAWEAFDKLVELDNVIAIKASGMDLAMIEACFERYSEKVLVSVPTIRQIPLIADTWPLQWTGAWTIEALQTPEEPLVVDMMSLLAEGEVDRAMELFWRMGPMMATLAPRLIAMFQTGIYHWTLFKYFQWLSGGNGGVTRQPAMRLSTRDMAEVREGYLRANLQLAPGDDEDFFLGRAITAHAPVAS